MKEINDLWNAYLSIKLPRDAPTTEIQIKKGSDPVFLWAPGPTFSAMPKSISRKTPGDSREALAKARRTWFEGVLPPGNGDCQWPRLNADEITSPDTRTSGPGRSEVDKTLLAIGDALRDAAQATGTLSKLGEFRDTATEAMVTATNTEIAALGNAMESCVPVAPEGLDLGRLLAAPAAAPIVTAARPDVAFGADVAKIFQLRAGEVRGAMGDPRAADITVMWVIQWALQQPDNERITPAAAAAFAEETGLYKACIVNGFLRTLKKQIRDYARVRKKKLSRYTSNHGL